MILHIPSSVLSPALIPALKTALMSPWITTLTPVTALMSAWITALMFVHITTLMTPLNSLVPHVEMTEFGVSTCEEIRAYLTN
jgi:hypothetical protein